MPPKQDWFITLEPLKQVLMLREMRQVASSGGKTVASANSKVGKVFSLDIPEAHLWSPDDPFLYDLQITLQGTTDEVSRSPYRT